MIQKLFYQIKKFLCKSIFILLNIKILKTQSNFNNFKKRIENLLFLIKKKYV